MISVDMSKMKVLLALLLGVLFQSPIPAQRDLRVRTPVNIPDIPGYQTLKCDFHLHTVFSDGSVWPDIRPEEAWREGLDAIAITDHLEYLPHKEDLPPNHDRSYEIAKPRGDMLRVEVIPGSEITRDMPPGHLNAIFVTAASELDTELWRDAVRKAFDQGAFIFWNHPGWAGQQPDGVAKWYPEHTELVEAGMLHGIEVVNEREYYPEAHRWCIDKKLTMLSNSDVHDPLNLDYEVHQGDHRPLTLVFAREKSVEAIKEALFARRTAVYSGNMLAGDEVFLRPIFEGSIRVRNASVTVRGRGHAYVQIHNSSDISFELSGKNSFPEISAPESLKLQAGRTVLLQVEGTADERTGSRQFTLSYVVDNLKIAPERGLPVRFQISATFEPVEP